MSEELQPTQETDARSCIDNLVCSDFARRLERERDQARRELAAVTKDRDSMVERFREEIKQRQETQRANAIIDTKILAASQQEVARLSKIADALLNHCDKEGGECSECGKIVCPHGEPLHFHHDGCPACATHDDALSPTPAPVRTDTERLDWLEKEDVWIGIEGEYDISARICCGKSYSQSVRSSIDAEIERTKIQ